MSENKELDVALVNIETKFRVETYPMKLGASEEAAKLISSSSDRIKKFVYDGLDLRFGKSDFQPRCFAFARTKFERRTSRRRSHRSAGMPRQEQPKGQDLRGRCEDHQSTAMRNIVCRRGDI